MSNDDSARRRDGRFTAAFGQSHALTLVDRLGIWLSARQIRRFTGSMVGMRVGDFGCGYDATFVRSVLHDISSAVLVDCSLASDLKCHPKITAIEGEAPDSLKELPSASLDIVLCISVLEHLWNPVAVIQECRRIVRPDGLCLFNVPSWRGKWFLEFSAFRLGLSPKTAMDDHKSYYDAKDLWPLLVKGGFLPSRIRCFSHKLGLNTFAVCGPVLGRTGKSGIAAEESNGPEKERRQ